MNKHKEQWKLAKARSLDKLKAQDKFSDLLHQLDIISLQTWTNMMSAIESKRYNLTNRKYEEGNYDWLE
jgi:hypothetical protein